MLFVTTFLGFCDCLCAMPFYNELAPGEGDKDQEEIIRQLQPEIGLDCEGH